MSKRSAPGEAKDSKESKRTKRSTAIAQSPKMSHSATMKRVLVVGLAGKSPGSSAKPSEGLPKGGFRKMLQNTIAEAQKHGLELEMIQVKPSAFQSGLHDLKLRLESKPDGLLVGNGIRGTADYTVFFEDLVNASREITPSTRLAFNTSPSDILECCFRNFRPDD